MSTILPVQFREFNLNQLQIKTSPSIAIIGKACSGKSYLCRKILNKLNMQYNIIISPTEKIYSFYKKYFPTQFIYNEYNHDIIKKLMDRQQQIDKRAILLMDGCMETKTILDNIMSHISWESKYLRITIIATMQYPINLQSIMRKKFDYTFLFTNYSDQRKIYNIYANIFPSYNDFKVAFNDMIINHGCMVIDNTKIQQNLWNTVFWYKGYNSITHVKCSTEFDHPMCNKSDNFKEIATINNSKENIQECIVENIDNDISCESVVEYVSNESVVEDVSAESIVNSVKKEHVGEYVSDEGVVEDVSAESIVNSVKKEHVGEYVKKYIEDSIAKDNVYDKSVTEDHSKEYMECVEDNVSKGCIEKLNNVNAENTGIFDWVIVHSGSSKNI
jgi:nicotinamide riboside kinase